jgi:hypothetical protein
MKPRNEFGGYRVFGVSAPGKPKGRSPSPSYTAKTRYAKPRKVECQASIRGVINCDELLVPFGFRHLESQGTENTCFAISRIAKAGSTSPVRPVVIVDDHIGTDKGW